MALVSSVSSLTDLYVHVKDFAIQESAYLNMRKDPSFKRTAILCEDPAHDPWSALYDFPLRVGLLHGIS